MTSRLRAALGEALTRLKSADVLSATAAIQRTLGIVPPASGERPDPAPTAGPARRGPLGDLFGSLARGLPGQAGPIGDDRLKPRTAPAQPADAGDLRFVWRRHEADAGVLDYKLYRPLSARPAALIVMLHGCSQDPDDFARGTRMNALAEEFGLIVAYPQQPRTANSHGCWNWFEGRHQSRGAGEPAMLAGLATVLTREFAIAPGRVFVAGLSAGGAMADVLATTYPEVFAAAGIHSGLPHGAACDLLSALGAMKGRRGPPDPTRRRGAGGVRKIIFHGDADAIVHVSNGSRILDRSRDDAARVEEIITDRTINGRKVTRTVLTATDGTPVAEHWLVHGAGHAWAGANSDGSFTDATGPDASREMIRFFLQG